MLLFLTLLGSVYIFLQLYLWYTWNRTANISINRKDLPDMSVTVLIPVRNEESNLQECIQSLLSQSYSYQHFEILVIDDHSDDGTAAVVKRYPMVQYHRLTGSLSGKKAAISAGVELASGEIILTLDGDCTVGEHWLINMVGSLIGKSADIVTGPVVIQAELTSNYVQKYQIAEQAAMNIVTGAGLKSRMLYSSNGANMGFYKAVFQEINPYAQNQHIASGDDVFFVQQAKAKGFEVAFVQAKKAIVSSNAQTNFDLFMEQRLRWSSKSVAYEHEGTQWYLRSFLMHNCIFLILLLLSIVHPLSRTFLFYFLIVKSTSDFILIRTGLWWSGQNLKTKDILLATYFQFFYTVLLVYRMAVQKGFTWKGRENSSRIKKSPLS